MKTKLLTIVALVLLLTGVIAYSRSHRRGKPSQQHLARGFTIESTLSENGKSYATCVRYVKSNGEFLADTAYVSPDGAPEKHTKLAGTIEHGAVVIDETNQKLKHAGSAVLLHATTENEIKALGFDREESLLGYRVIVQRRCLDQNGHCAEYWLAPDLGGAPLKLELVEPDGTRKTEVATRIVLGEPSFVVPNYPVDTSIKDKIEKPRQTQPSQSPR